MGFYFDPMSGKYRHYNSNGYPLNPSDGDGFFYNQNADEDRRRREEDEARRLRESSPLSWQTSPSSSSASSSSKGGSNDTDGSTLGMVILVVLGIVVVYIIYNTLLMLAHVGGSGGVLLTGIPWWLVLAGHIIGLIAIPSLGMYLVSKFSPASLTGAHFKNWMSLFLLFVTIAPLVFALPQEANLSFLSFCFFTVGTLTIVCFVVGLIHAGNAKELSDELRADLRLGGAVLLLVTTIPLWFGFYNAMEEGKNCAPGDFDANSIVGLFQVPSAQGAAAHHLVLGAWGNEKLRAHCLWGGLTAGGITLLALVLGIAARREIGWFSSFVVWFVGLIVSLITFILIVTYSSEAVLGVIVSLWIAAIIGGMLYVVSSAIRCSIAGAILVSLIFLGSYLMGAFF